MPFRVTKFEVGHACRLRIAVPLQVAVGGTGALFAKLVALNAAYGKNPIGATVFAKFSLMN